MVLVYATVSDYQSWAGQDIPGNLPSLLRGASLLVTGATESDVYAVDGTGLPTDATVAAAFRDAVCAQAQLWATNGVDPAAGQAGVSPVVSQAQQGGRSVSYALGVDADRIAKAQVTHLCPQAVQILRSVGLLNGEPVFL